MTAPIPSHHMDSKIQPGTTFESYRNGMTGTRVETMRRKDRLFVAHCTYHDGFSQPTPYRDAAHKSARFPQGWCEGCRKKLGISIPDGFAKPAGNARQCELCDTFNTTVMTCGHVDSAESILVCPTCHKGAKYEKLYQKRFGELVKGRREDWKEMKGMTKAQRRLVLKRIAKSPEKGKR